MSQQNVERLLASTAAFNRGDLDGALADYHPEVEFRALQHPSDAPERLQGVSAVRAYSEQWYEAFDDFTAEIEEIIDAGRFVLTLIHWRGTGKGSDRMINLRTCRRRSRFACAGLASLA